MKSPENIQDVLALKPDFMGFILYPKSSRMVDIPTLSNWIENNVEVFKDTKRVGVFVNAEIDYVLNNVHDLLLDYVQLHGTESPEYCKSLIDFWGATSMRSAKIIKAFPVDESFDFDVCARYEPFCEYFLFDTKVPQHGGSGLKFDWTVLHQYKGIRPFLLAGGIGSDDALAVREVDVPQMAGIDINSRFEIEPALKDNTLLKKFVKIIG